MIYKGNSKEIKDYFDNQEAVSQSKLKLLLQGVSAYTDTSKTDEELYYSEKGYRIIGKGVDTKLTLGEVEFFNNFHVAVSEKPSEKSLSIITYLYDTITNGMSITGINSFRMNMIPDAAIVQACELHEYQSRWGDESKVKAIRKMDGYFNELCISNGKQILSLEEMNKITKISERMINSQYGYLFDDAKHVNFDGIDVYTQVPVYASINNVKAKIERNKRSRSFFPAILF